jgi:hypothetical protein
MGFFDMNGMENGTTSYSTPSKPFRWPIVLALAMVIVTLAVVIWLVARRRSKGGGGAREAWQDRFDVQTRNASRCPEDDDIRNLQAMIGLSSSAAANDARDYLDGCLQVNAHLQVLNTLQLEVENSNCTQNLTQLLARVNNEAYPHPIVSQRVASLRAMVQARMRNCSLYDANRAIDDLDSTPSAARMILGTSFVVGIAVLVVTLSKVFFKKFSKKEPNFVSGQAIGR